MDSQTTQSLIAKSRSIAVTEVPASGNEYTGAILEIFKANPGKHFSGKSIKALFAEMNVEIKNVSNVLFALKKKGALKQERSGWYTLA